MIKRTRQKTGGASRSAKSNNCGLCSSTLYGPRWNKVERRECFQTIFERTEAWDRPLNNPTSWPTTIHNPITTTTTCQAFTTSTFMNARSVHHQLHHNQPKPFHFFSCFFWCFYFNSSCSHTRLPPAAAATAASVGGTGSGSRRS